MAGACPVSSPDDPLVQGLIGVVDCSVRELVHSGYSSIFQPNGALAGVLTAILTLYVALIGYRLLLGRGQLSVGEFALTAVKLGGVLALATQWDTYQTVIYNLLFQGPQQLADAMLVNVQPDSSSFHGDVFDGLQRAFDDLTRFSTGYAGHSPAQASPLLGGAGFAAFLLTSSGSILLLSSLGVLLAAKIVLGLLLAIGPVFIALFLFDSTRGLSEGWLRAALAFAFAPLAITLLLGVTLTMLEPALLQIEALQAKGVYTLAPVYSVMTLIMVFAAVALGALVAAGTIASGFKLPGRHTPAGDARTVAQSRPAAATLVLLPRAARVAAAATALDRRDTISSFSSRESTSDRRTSLIAAEPRNAREIATQPVRLGEQRRTIRPRSTRPNARIAR